MPIGSSDGNYYDSYSHYLMDMPQSLADADTEALKKSPGYDPESDTYTAHIFRHGDINLKDNHGWSSAPINAEGENHAEKAADTANKQNLDVLYTSDLPRTMQTADVIANKTAMQPIPTEALRTWDLGAYTGKTDQASIDAVQRLCSTALNEAPPSGNGYQGESFNDFKTRILGGVGDILLQHPNQEVGLVTHRAVHGVLDSWDKAGQKSNGKLDMDQFHKENIEPGGHKSMDLDAQAAREVATNKMIGSIVRAGADQPNTQLARQQAQQFMQPIKDMPGELLRHPENIVGTGELTGAFGGPIGAARSIFGKLRLKAAQDMEVAGHSPGDIFSETNWYKDADDHWKFVIPPGKIIKDKLDVKPATSGEGWTSVGSEETLSVPFKLTGTQLKLKDIYDNPELYQMYPEIAEHKVGPIIFGSWNTLGGYSKPTKATPEGMFKLAGGKQEHVMQSVIEHEVQHAIQHIEGFPAGGNAKMFEPSNMKTLEELLDKREGDLKAQLHAEGDFGDDLKAFDQVYRDARIFSNKVTSGKPEDYQSFNEYMSGKFDKFTDKTRLKTLEIFRQNPDLVEEFIQNSQWNKDFRDIKEGMHKAYEKIYGEVEARNAQLWAKGGFVGATPRETAAMDIPEAERILARDVEPQMATGNRSPYGPISPKKELNPDHIKEMLSLPGVRLRDVANALEVSYPTLLKAVREFGIDYKPPAQYNKMELNVGEYKRLEEEGLTQKQIAERMGVSQTFLKDARRRQGMRIGTTTAPIEPEKKVLYQRGDPRVSDTDLRADLATDMSWKEIAQKHGIEPNHMNRRLRRLTK